MKATALEIPTRSLLFVPGHDARKIERARASGAHAIIIDLEDAVAPSMKDAARATAASALQAFPRDGAVAFVRINKDAKGYCAADIDGTMSPNLQGFVLPKCDSRESILTVCRRLERKEKSLRIQRGTFRLILLLETASGLVRLPEFLEDNSRVAGIALGAEDFCLDAGIERTAGDPELLYARSRISIFARAHGRMAFDSVFTDVKNPEGLIKESVSAKNLGFSGKLAIHPNQIGAIHQAFAPSKAELAHARKVLDAFAEAEKDHRAVCLVDGKMIDRPIVERAKKLLRGF
jgi:citrate lyase subunit beta/citryl-CoA lyase